MPAAYDADRDLSQSLRLPRPGRFGGHRIRIGLTD